MTPERHIPVIAVALGVVALFPAQIPSPPPMGAGGRREPTPVTIEDAYGPLQVVDLEQLAHSGQTYHRRLVLTRGAVGDLVPGRYFSLERNAARVMLIPLEEGNYDDYLTMLGKDVDVTGVVRVLPVRQATVSCRGMQVLESKCEDWDLPVLPDAPNHWPSVSLTVTKMMDRGTDGGERRPGSRAGADTAVVGQFRGANLCHDLPMDSRRNPADWVLLTSGGPMWVTGRPPTGRGFHLDPGYRGDTTRWLEVSGKVEVVGTVRYLKAGKVAMIGPPEESQPMPCPP